MDKIINDISQQLIKCEEGNIKLSNLIKSYLQKLKDGKKTWVYNQDRKNLRNLILECLAKDNKVLKRPIFVAEVKML